MIALIALKLMESGLGPKAAKLLAWAGVLLLAVLALWMAYSLAYNRGEADERSKWEAAAEILRDADAAADAEALDVAIETKGNIDASNERAKQAAAGSDDPLASGFDSLRKENPRGGGQAPR